jgi:D-threo-aldose 1-dehydrogenase
MSYWTGVSPLAEPVAGRPALGLGGGYLESRGDEQGLAVLRAALDGGVTYFDTAPGYGRSQDIMGRGLYGLDGLFIATKIGHFALPQHYRDPQALWAQLRANLARLGRDRVQLVQIHEADSASWWRDVPAGQDRMLELSEEVDFADAPIMAVLHEARRQGLCQTIGITGNNPVPLGRVLGAVDVDCCLVAYNYDLIWRGAARELVPLAQQRRVPLLLASISHIGRLVATHPEWLVTPPPWMTPGLRERFARLYSLADQAGLSLVELGVRFVLGEPRAAGLLLGASRPEQVLQSLNAAARGPLPRDLHDAIEALGTYDGPWL